MNLYQQILLPTAELLGEVFDLMQRILFYEVFPNVKVIGLLSWLGVVGIVTLLIVNIIRGK